MSDMTSALLNFRFLNIAFIYTSHVYIYRVIEVAEGADLADNISQNENKYLTLTKHLSRNEFGSFLFEYLKEYGLYFSG